MASIVTKFKKALLLGTISALLLLVFIVDIVRKSIDLEVGWIILLREVFVILAFLIFYLLVESLWKREQTPAKKMGFALVLSIAVACASAMLFIVSPSGFEIKNATLIPLGLDSVLWSNIYGVILGVSMIMVLMILRDILFSKRRKGTKRNFIILLSMIIGTAISTMVYPPMEGGMLSTVLFIVTIVAMLLNSFRVSWIVYLSKREKILSIIYGFLLFGIFIGFDLITSKSSSVLGQSILFYSPPLQSFVSTVSLFATIYFGMTFISTLFHLPTAEAFDRKLSEVSSLHNLGKLVTQVFDFNELADSVTTMTLEVCEAKSAWLEILHTDNALQGSPKVPGNSSLPPGVSTAARKNISHEETEIIMAVIGGVIRKQIVDGQMPIVIDNIEDDQRTQRMENGKNKFKSMAIVPLLSHDNVIGILYATKDVEYGFDKDDIDVISTFADQATIAIENSRLIEKSIERERLMREMMLAQEMQKKLLPQNLPELDEIELEALSTPAFEVGGDYYDFLMLDDRHLGVLVGDVSGKGVSAAFYMAEMKGIFQSLSRIYREPRDFLIHAQSTLIGTIDKRSFISIVYAVIDLDTGIMKVARAGHCPLLYVTKGKSEYIKPTGLGLGMGNCAIFERTIAQEEIHLSRGDVAVLYTDGVTEAYPEDGLEFGYERLQEIVSESAGKSAMDIRDVIIMAVDEHMNHASPDDDLTIVVLKWKK